MKMKKHYPQTKSEVNFAELEKEILEFWEQDKSFTKSIDSRTNKEFVFYDGPPFANGLPHHGHLLTGFIKDAFARYQTMMGKKVERRFGWDCHGLPAEIGAEKESGISGRAAIEKFGIAKFNDICRKSVMKFADQWQNYVTRQARWVNFHNDYKTMDISFMESVIWGFKQLYEKGLIYKSMRVMPYSWACETPLSNFETKMDNAYRKKTSKAITVVFELLTPVESLPGKSMKVLAWTTTPWTLPSNLILAIGKDVKYGAVTLDNGRCYVAACNYLKSNYQDKEIFEIPRDQLIGKKYKPLFNYFADNKNSFVILSADFVLEEEGTGIVHVAPGFGEDDFALCKKHEVPVVCPVDNTGKFTDEVPDFVGMQVFAANDEIIKYLKKQDSWVKTEQYIHNYPHCWRTDTPLIYKAISSWYVKVTAFKERMIEVNKEINWIPNHIRNGQFGKWLEGARDWSISRNRFWGTPIPIWQSDNPKYPRIDVYGSIATLEKDFGVKIKDLHRPYIDGLTRPNPDDPTGKSKMRRVEDVLDCWFESGSMPYGQVHYPFENKERFENNFPADFITEYVSQTRGWFYTLVVLSTALFDRPPFKNCICHGIVLDTRGQKLSKRLNNYADPTELFDKYGSDALRFLMLSDSVVSGGDLLLDKEGNMVRDTLRLVIKPIWNAYHFFTIYANADGIEAKYDTSSENLLDRYILAKCYQTISRIKSAFDAYDTTRACKNIIDFFDALNNWYIRRSRDRFWQSGYNSDKQCAYDTLYVIFHLTCRAAAPLLPLLTEKIWLGIDNKTSVHLENFPKCPEFNDELIDNMDKVRDLCNAALSIRNKYNIRIRQPLSKIIIFGEKINIINNNMNINLIKNEVNVKNVEFNNNIKLIAKFILKLNFPALGKRLPQKVKEIGKLAKQGKWHKNNKGEIQVGEVILYPEEGKLLLRSNVKNTQTLSMNDVALELDTNITEELTIEGIARDIVRFIQQARKEANLHITDKIELTLETSNEKYKQAITKWDEYIKEETLANSIDIGKTDDSKLKFNPIPEFSIGFNKIDA
ncbi:MAG: isoleucine--tRNA ligase [Rickettsiaceae bacterium H1]|nr:isoleucine--tRNA ligase [Rickettsiaceae bacterium H1]